MSLLKTNNSNKGKIETVQTNVIHGYWYRNWNFPFFHYQEPVLIIVKDSNIYAWNNKIWIKQDINL